eukprot:gene4237-biopygen2113
MKGAGNVKVSKRPKAPKFEFIAWVHGKGDKAISGPNAVKITPQQAAKLMWLVGTVEGAIKYPDDPFMMASPTGQRKFLFLDLLHPSQIKAYMSRTNKSLRDLFEKHNWRESNILFQEGEVEDAEEDSEDD